MSTFEQLDLESQIEVDKLCEHFQSELAEGNSASIASLVRAVDRPTAKAALFRELLAIVLESRSAGGHKSTVETIRTLVPEEIIEHQDELIGDVLAKWISHHAPRMHASSQPSESSDSLEGATKQNARLGCYQLIDRLGHGTFGEVWKAHDARLNRFVAVKTPRYQTLRPEEMERFSKEAQAAARLKHPNIVAVHEIGEHDQRPFIVTDLVDGRSLDQWRREKQPAIDASVESCIAIASALHHAHEQGVIHRDLKPTNILIDSHDRPFVTDFGLAKLVADETITMEGNLLGSPAYMPPEQARGDAYRADRRSDVYALGVILYELLVGERPFSGSPESVLHQVLHTEPTPPRKLKAGIPIDLETICLKCLAKEPGARYATAAELSDDLQRFASGQSIHARPLSPAARVWRWTKRNPWFAGTTAVSVLLLLILAISGPLIALDRARQLQQQQQQLYVADMIVAKQAFEASNTDRTREIVDKYASNPELRSLRCFDWYYMRHQARNIGVAAKSFGIGKPHIWLALSPDGRLLSTDGRNILNRNDLSTVRRYEDGGGGVCFHPTKPLVATGVTDKQGVSVWNLDSGRLEEHMPNMPNWSLTYSADGAFLASCLYFLENEFAVWDVVRQRKIEFRGGDAESSHKYKFLDWSPTGNRLIVTGFSQLRSGGRAGPRRGLLTIVDFEQDGSYRARTIPVNSQWTRKATFSPDGLTLAVTTSTSVQLLHGETGELRREFPLDGAESVAISPDGQLLACGSWTGPVKVWDLTASNDALSSSNEITLIGHSSQVSQIRFAPDGCLLSIGQVKGEVIVWGHPNLRTDVLARHPGGSLRARVCPDNRNVVSVGEDGIVAITDLSTRRRIKSFSAKPRVMGEMMPDVSVSPDGASLAIANGESVDVMDIQSERRIDRLHVPGAGLMDIEFSPDGHHRVRWKRPLSDGLKAAQDTAQRQKTMTNSARSPDDTLGSFRPLPHP